MRFTPKITCVVLLFACLLITVNVYSDEAGQAPLPDQVAAESEQCTPAESETYFDPELESILAVKDRSRYAFLSRLTAEEQHELARIIKERVDEEAGVVVSIMAIVSRFVPAFISAQFADKMEPATVARISDKVSVGKAIAIGKRLDPEFLAEVAVFQDPDKVTAVVEGLPDDDLTEITRILFARGEYRTVAGFSDGLSPEKLKSVAEKIDDPATLIEIARYMKNRDKTVQTAVSLSDDYLLGFMSQLSSAEDYKLAAAVGRELDVDRQVRMLNRLDMDKAAMLASYYPPETIARIMKTAEGGVPDTYLFEITRILLERGDYQVMAGISDALSVDVLTRVAEKIDDPAGLMRIARHMKDKEKMAKTAIGLSDDYLLGFLNQLSSGEDYELAATVGRDLDIDRQVDMLSRLDTEKAVRLASYYPSETIARILEKAGDENLSEIASRLKGCVEE